MSYYWFIFLTIYSGKKYKIKNKNSRHEAVFLV